MENKNYKTKVIVTTNETSFKAVCEFIPANDGKVLMVLHKENNVLKNSEKRHADKSN